MWSSSRKPISTRGLTAALREQAGAGVGGIVTFVGYVRDYAPDAPTETLFLEHYPGMCERELEDIAATARARWNLAGTVIVHRVGAVAQRPDRVRGRRQRPPRRRLPWLRIHHRRAQDARAFWKSETLAGGKRFWVEQRQADEDRTRSWDEPRPATRTRHEASPAEPVSLACAVLTVSDTRGPGDDTSGNLLAQSLAQAGHQCVRRDIVRTTLPDPPHHQRLDRRSRRAGHPDLRRHGLRTRTPCPRPSARCWTDRFPASASCSASCPTKRSAARPCNRGPCRLRQPDAAVLPARLQQRLRNRLDAHHPRTARQRPSPLQFRHALQESRRQLTPCWISITPRPCWPTPPAR